MHGLTSGALRKGGRCGFFSGGSLADSYSARSVVSPVDGRTRRPCAWYRGLSVLDKRAAVGTAAPSTVNARPQAAEIGATAMAALDHVGEVPRHEAGMKHGRSKW